MERHSLAQTFNSIPTGAAEDCFGGWQQCFFGRTKQDSVHATRQVAPKTHCKWMSRRSQIPHPNDPIIRRHKHPYPPCYYHKRRNSPNQSYCPEWPVQRNSLSKKDWLQKIGLSVMHNKKVIMSTACIFGRIAPSFYYRNSPLFLGNRTNEPYAIKVYFS